MWVHGGFAVYTIASFGALTLLFHNEILRSHGAAAALAAFIGIYWLLRVVVDFTYYDHADSPKGKGFVAGHALLTLLFVFLFITYLSISLRAWLANPPAQSAPSAGLFPGLFLYFRTIHAGNALC